MTSPTKIPQIPIAPSPLSLYKSASNQPLMPHATLLKYPGTNCDAETARALQLVGFTTSIIPIADATVAEIEKSQLVMFSGGFSYGDYVMSGRLAQLVTESKLGDAIQNHHARGGFTFGICNGFQILTKLGILPTGSLIDNTSERFVCCWAKLQVKNTSSPYLQGLPAEFELPVAHAEGRFVTFPGDAETYLANGNVALTYADNFNGSTLAIAGLQDPTGRAFGLMPHPERFIQKNHHYDPDWNLDPTHGWGYYMFKSLASALA